MEEFNHAGTIEKDGSTTAYVIHVSGERGIISDARNPNIVIDGQGNPANIMDFFPVNEKGTSSTPPPRPFYKDPKQLRETIKLFEENGFTITIDPRYKNFFC